MAAFLTARGCVGRSLPPYRSLYSDALRGQLVADRRRTCNQWFSTGPPFRNLHLEQVLTFVELHRPQPWHFQPIPVGCLNQWLVFVLGAATWPSSFKTGNTRKRATAVTLHHGFTPYPKTCQVGHTRCMGCPARFASHVSPSGTTSCSTGSTVSLARRPRFPSGLAGVLQ